LTREYLPNQAPVNFDFVFCFVCLSQSCVLFQLLQFFCSCILSADDAGDVKADKLAAQRIISDQLLTLQTLFRSFDPATVDTATGNNALHELCTLFFLDHVDCWDYKLAELFIDCGVSIHARHKNGRTPLLQCASSVGEHDSTANGLRLLLAHGSDPNA